MISVIDDNIFENAKEIFEKEVEKILQTKERVLIGLVGGRSVQDFYLQFDSMALPWQKLTFLALDERQVPFESEQSNSRQIQEQLAAHVSFIPYDNKKGIDQYQLELEKHGGYFDIIIVSAGEDGHIASLFPQHDSIKNEQLGFIQVEDAPKQPPKRISASRKTILHAQVAFLFFVGESKKDAYENYQKKPAIKDFPATLINYIPNSYVFVDVK
ncbi:MAG: 6-phosphogluconolactonase [Candidatus Woesearchaeota archaeon]